MGYTVVVPSIGGNNAGIARTAKEENMATKKTQTSAKKSTKKPKALKKNKTGTTKPKKIATKKKETAPPKSGSKRGVAHYKPVDKLIPEITFGRDHDGWYGVSINSKTYSGWMGFESKEDQTDLKDALVACVKDQIEKAKAAVEEQVEVLEEKLAEAEELIAKLKAPAKKKPKAKKPKAPTKKAA